MPGISNDYPFFFSFTLFLSLFSLCPRSLNVIRSRHIRTFRIPRRSHPALSFDAEIDAVACRSFSVPPSLNDELQFDIYFNYRDALNVDRSDFGAFLSAPRHLVSALHQLSAGSAPSLSFFSLPLRSFLSFSSSSFSVSSRRRRRIITRKPEFHFALIERSARRCAERTRAPTFPSLDVRRISHDSSRVSGYSERGGSFQRRGDETIKIGEGGTVALFVRRKSHRSLAKYVSTFVPCPRAVRTTRRAL